MEAMAQSSKAGAPTLTAVDVSGNNVVLSWTHDFDTPRRGFDIHINGRDTRKKYRTYSTTQTISNLDLTQSHCFNIEATYSRKSKYLSNQLCSEAQSPEPSLPMGPPTLNSVDLVAGNFLLSWSQENADPDSGYDIFIDGVDTGSSHRTSDESASISGLSLTTPHCFKIEARYESAQAFYLSNEVCHEVQVANQAPVISGTPTTSVTQDESYLFMPNASDPDGDALSFSITGKPAWASFDTSTGSLSGTPSDGTAGLYSGITISVSDGELSDSMPTFTIQVVEPEPINQAPVIGGLPVTSVTEGEAYLFTPSASDPDGDALSFTITNKPAWASFNTSSGALSGSPAIGTAGLYSNIIISVSDGELSQSLGSFNIQVNEAATSLTGPPTLISVETVSSNIVLSWSTEYAIPDGGYDIFIDGLDTGTQNRTTSTTVSLSGLDLSTSHCFSVESRYTDTSEFYSSNQLCSEVANQPPEISGTPSTTVTVGTNYSFTPDASDTDSSSLSFSVDNLPVWANFDSETGTVSGTPQATDIGAYDNILISVSDGTDVSQLAAFSISVEDIATLTSTTLDWVAPSSREDGSTLALSEIEGYRIYMGDSESTMAPVMDINDHTATNYTLNEIPQGDHYFAVTVYDTEGTESGMSNIILRSCN
jgi:hypothetical protein